MKTLTSVLLTTLTGIVSLPALALDCREVNGAAEPVCRFTSGYATTNINGRQQLDVYYRPDNRDARVLVVVPGGAWSGGDKADYRDLAESLTGLHDLTTVVVNYRLSDGIGRPVKHPDHVDDVAAAFSWVKRNIAGYGDPARVYAFGQSAGAHLVSLMATDPQYLAQYACANRSQTPCKPSDIRAVISMSGVYNLPQMVDLPNEVGLDGVQAAALEAKYAEIVKTAFGRVPETWRQASPLLHINPGQPPFLVLYSFDDMPGFAGQAHDFAVAVDAMLREARPTAADPGVRLRRLERLDYTPEVWRSAFCLAAGGELTEDGDCAPGSEGLQEDFLFTGHYAEVVAINPNEPHNYPTELVVDFIARH